MGKGSGKQEFPRGGGIGTAGFQGASDERATQHLAQTLKENPSHQRGVFVSLFSFSIYNELSMKKIVIIYHKDCPDGFGGAWAAWKKFKDKAEYIAVYPRALPSKVIKDREVYIVDNSYPKEAQQRLMDTNKSVVVLDHHESSEKDVRAFPQNVFDNNHSGAVLAWKHFHPKKPVPTLLKYVEDVDLWKHVLPHSREINMYTSAYKFDFKQWDVFARKLEKAKTRTACVREGAAIMNYFNRVVLDAVNVADYVQFGKYKVYATNFSSKRFTSEIGNSLAKKYPPFGIIWHEEGNVLYVSMRSDGTVDVAKIAEQYYGGGHKAAAAFKIPFAGKFPWKILEKK